MAMTTRTEPKIGNLQVINCDFRGYNMDGTDAIQYTRNDAGEIIHVDFTMDGWLCFGPTITRETEPDVLQKLAEAYGNQRTTADEERQALMDALQSQAERIEELNAGMTQVRLERDTLRAQLAALQSDDELPGPFAYALETTNYGLDNEQWDTVELRKDKWDEDCWPLFRVDQLRQAQAKVRAKMVPLEKDAATRYQEIREALTDLMDWQVKNLRIWTHPTWDNAQAVIFRHDAAMGITGEPK